MMKLSLQFLLLFTLLPYGAMTNAQPFPELPARFNGWSLTDKLILDTHQSLYDYIDGGAELYISYGFKNAISCRYTKEGQPEVTAEIFDLGTASDAYGVYSQTRDKEEKDYGQGSYYVSGAQFFWKGRFWVSLMTGETTEESESFLKTLAAFIDERITETGEPPAILSVLPAEELVPGGTLYFHHYIWLNSYYFIASDNILEIDNDTPAILAKYGVPEERIYLLAIQYPDSTKAGQAFASFEQQFFPGGLDDNTIKTEENTWISAGLYYTTIIVVFNGKEKTKARELLRKARDLVYLNQDQRSKIKE
ncbi:MAG: hypothetical protein JXR41_13445 [Bacteroidales bacterium]|nr:hypothetical protein [Bacteroidales bacterium]MBN2764092.1 hypothetical protein [Bacteroidales bacterium]